jgi:hypothetical protein
MIIKPSLKFAIRIDDCPDDLDPVESENMAKIAEKHEVPLTLAICSGFLKDWKDHHSVYKRLFKKGLLNIACHGWKPDDFGGIGMVGEFSTSVNSLQGPSLAENIACL